MFKILPISLCLLFLCLTGFSNTTPPDKFDPAGTFIKPATCGRNNGSVKNVQLPANVSWTWKDNNGSFVSADTNLVNVGPGIYHLSLLWQVSSEQQDVSFTIGTAKEPPVPANFQITQPDCGLRTGTISYKGNFESLYKYAWVNDKRQVIIPDAETNNPLKDMSQGFYTLRVSLAVDSTCFTFSDAIELANLSGPYFDLASVKISNATCRLANGSVRSVYVRNTSGSFFCQWEDSVGNIMSKTIDLFGVPKGKYHMKFKDASNCDTLITPYFVVDGTGYISIDSTMMKVRPSDCKNSKGAITGIAIDNANQFEWLDINSGMVVSNTADLYGRTAGKYQLLTSNGLCNLATKPITIMQSAFDSIKVKSISVTDAHCDSQNGSINSIQFNKNPFSYHFEWKNASDATVSANIVFSSAAGGSYRLIATDSNQCSASIFNQKIEVFGKPGINYNGLVVKPDTCGFAKGSLSGISAAGGAGSYSWKWFTSTGNLLSSSANISALRSGSYYATVADSFNCEVKSRDVEIRNESITWAAPAASDREILKGSSATINVINPIPGLYQLFDHSSASTSISTSYEGVFKTPVLTDTKHYYIRYDSGTCRSALRGVTIKMIVQKDVMVPNGFSPNQDTHNDIFKPLFSTTPAKYFFTVYSRWGKKIFDTNEVKDGWNGKSGLLPADPGIYVWVCSYQLPGEELKTLKGNVMLVR